MVGRPGPSVADGHPSTPIEALPISRLELLDPIGRGGMGEVWRAWDPDLARTVAVKILREDLPDPAEHAEAFLSEARATAVLQHPGIIQVHSLHRLMDGRPCYAMLEVDGRTLHEDIRALHADTADAPADRAPGIRRLLRVFEQVCRTMAYVHAKGVIHRDLKPENVMLGPFGEVFVLDWGLARALRGPSRRESPGTGTSASSFVSDGGIAGTPAYMAPEQAWPGLSDLSPATDVYALGAMLYEILTGRHPVTAVGHEPLLHRVALGRVDPLPETEVITPDLARICQKALQRYAEDRHPDAGVLADAIAGWFEQQDRHAQARTALAEADSLAPRITALRQQASTLYEAAARALAAIPNTAPVEQRAAIWAEQDTAAGLEREAGVLTALSLQHIQAALTAVPDLPGALDRLADHHRAALVEARARRDDQAEARALTLLRLHDRGRHAAWLAGAGALTLRTDPPGAEVELHRFVVTRRRLDTTFVRTLGRTPLDAVDVPPGSWLLVLRHPDRPEVRYPIEVGGEALWTSIPPGESEPQPVPLPTAGDVPPGTVYIPPGPARLGGDPRAPLPRPAERPWIPGFFLQREPVTNGDWLKFVHDLAASGRAEHASGLVPVDAGLLYDWSPGLPVRNVDARAAEAYALWCSPHGTRRWRLPTDPEWEKAARGVDGRAFPWGDFLDPAWCNMRDGHTVAPTALPTAARPGDVSVYGVFGLGGNVRCWCADRTPVPGTRSVRGGSFLAPADDCRAAGRAYLRADTCDPTVGVRLAWDGPR